MIYQLPKKDLIKIKNSAVVQNACMEMYKRKYRQLEEIHGERLPEVLQPFIDRMQGKLYTIPTDSWGTAAHAVWMDHHRDSTALIHCHAGIWYQSQNPEP